MSNIDTVKEIYEAFGRGDVPAILSRLSDSVEWDYSGNSDEVSWLKHRRGKEKTKKFFEAIGGLHFNVFEPKELLEGEDAVVAILDIDAVYKPTGKGFAEKDAMHLWRFDSEGKVIRFCHGVDTYQHHLAFNPQTITAVSAN